MDPITPVTATVDILAMEPTFVMMTTNAKMSLISVETTATVPIQRAATTASVPQDILQPGGMNFNQMTGQNALMLMNARTTKSVDHSHIVQTQMDLSFAPAKEITFLLQALNDFIQRMG